MKENPEHEILDTLQLSFDGLEDMEKQIFLDIACFFKGKKKDHTTKRLEGCGFYPDIGLKVLIEKSLITVVGEEKLWMHDLLQEMGWKIVRQESPDEPGKRSRLWLCKDIFHVLTKNTGTNDVEGMVLDLLEPEEMQLDAKAFLKLKKMRLLFFRNVHFSHSLEYLSNELRFLKWHGYGFKELPCSFQAKELVELNMCYSQVEQLWKGTKQFNKLQIMKLSHSKNLINTPDFRGLPNIEKLILEGCDELLEIDQSIGVLERLVLLNLKDCRKLSSLPESIYCLKALKILNLSGCIVLDYMLEELGNMKSLEELDVSMTTINQPTSSFSQFKNLKILSLRGCTGRPQPIWKSQSSLLQANSSNASDLYSLMVLDLSNCNLQEETIPSDLSCLSSLTELYLSGNSFSSLPASICRLTKLENLYLDNCGNLQSLQAIPSNVKLLSAQACSALETLPETFDLSGLQSPRFNFTNCFKLAASNQACNNVAFMILRNYLQGLSNPKSGFDIIVPGSHVPDWLTHQSSGESSISIELPPVWSDSIGFAICAVFVIYPEPLLNFMDLDLTCCIKIRGHTYRHELDYSFIEMELVGSDQLWLFYLPRNEFLDIDCRKDVAEVGSHAEVMFTAHGVGLHVKTFGVRVIYEQDVMMFNQKMSQICSSTTHENLNVLHVDNDMAKPVRKSSGEEEPEPKRLKKD